MPLYCGVNGVKHKIKGLYTGIGGVKKELTEMWAAENGVKKLVYQAVKGTQIGSMPVGSVVKINENGNPVNYLIVHQGLPSSMYDASCNGTWLLRKNTLSPNDSWGRTNKLENSTIHGYLNGTFLKRYNSSTLSAIKQVKIPYRKGGGANGTNCYGADGLSCKAFALSGCEVGWTTSLSSKLPVDGDKLAYFELGDSSSANYKREAYKEGGRSTDWWLRSPRTDDDDYVWRASGSGCGTSSVENYLAPYRPALILSPSTLVDDLGNIIA